MKQIKSISRFFVYWYNSALNYINFYYAKKKADKQHALTGKRYHVIPTGKHSLSVVNNDYINFYNKVGQGKKGFKKIDIVGLLKMSYYSTSVQSITRK